MFFIDSLIFVASVATSDTRVAGYAQNISSLLNKLRKP
ncbi:hypothetical protein AWB80_01173 [Caballeronia pedi]|uniref:Uncharacterized protein n=1 Tax=Caballeronia pedi TaxID=1777141 RepID=A0A157ZR93_9BURK|nr:hypothetical protein AWB80_01173 [Caballeronia pedi]